MQVKLFYSILLSLGLCFAAQAQKVVVIDTVALGVKKKQLVYTYYTRGIIKYMMYVHHSGEDDITFDYDANRTPNLIAIINENDVDSGLYFVMDDMSSTIKIVGLNALDTDTLHMDSWTVYKNKLGDTLINSTVYSKFLNDSVVSASYRSRSKITGNAPKEVPLRQLSLVINNRPYIVSLDTSKVERVMQYLGYKPYRRYEKYLSDTEHKKKYRYKSVCYMFTRKYLSYSGTLDLSKMNADE